MTVMLVRDSELTSSQRAAMIEVSERQKLRRELSMVKKEQERVLTICPFCGGGCGIYLNIEDGKITGTEPDKLHPVNEGELCVK
ncbi:MAG: hypothetical protein ACOY3J_12715, partial [Bacillota bacterium]